MTIQKRGSARLAVVMGLCLTLGLEPLQGQEITVPEVSPIRPAWAGDDVPDPLWRLMEAAVSETDEGRAREMLVEAEAFARRELDGHETDAGRHFALAAALGLRADREGGRTKIRAASQLHEALETVLALEPGHARANYLMGRLHAGVRRMNGVTRWLATNLLGGATLKQASWARAEEYLTFAEARAPDVPDHHLQLARLYQDTGRPHLAVLELAHVLDMGASTPMEHEVLAEARDLAVELAVESAPDGR